MSPKLPRITATQLLRALQRKGWKRDHQTGGHVFLRHSAVPGTVVVPNHAGRTIKLGTLSSILDQAGLTVQELIELL